MHTVYLHYTISKIRKSFQNWKMRHCCSKIVFLLLAWNATFIPQLGEFDDDAFLLFFSPSQDTCICCQDKMIKGHLIVFYDMKYPVPLS